MFEFLNSPWSFASIAILCLTLIFVISKVGYIAVAKLGLTIGKQDRIKKSPHSSCPHSKDIMDIIHRTTEFYEKIHIMKSSVIEEQMRYYEEVEEEIMGSGKNVFLKNLLVKLSREEPFINHEDYSHYFLVLKIISFEIKSYVRSCFKSNHYITYDIEAQRDYVEKKVTVIVQKITELLNLYWRGKLISRNDLHDINKELRGKLENSIEDVFNRAFLITRNTQERIEKAEKDYQQYVTFVVGEKSELI